MPCPVGGCAWPTLPCPWHPPEVDAPPAPAVVVQGGRYGDRFAEDLEDWTLTDEQLTGTPERSRQVHDGGELAWQQRFGRKRHVHENLIVREAGQPRWCLRERLRQYAKADNVDVFVELDLRTRTATWHGWEWHAQVLRWPRREIGTLWLVRGIMQPMSAYPPKGGADAQ